MPRQLPADVRGFVNRADELHRLDAILAERDGGDTVVVALCVVAGTAGAGKTSLALRWAHQVKAHFPDGQLYVNLRGYDPGEPVTAQEALHRFLTGLGVPANAVPTNTESAAGLFRSLLADRRILIVLDNAAAAAQVRPLLPGHSGCLVVVTSRGRLSGLSVRDGAHRITLGTLPELEAVALLRAVTSGYRPEDNAEKLAELARLCARLLPSSGSRPSPPWPGSAGVRPGSRWTFSSARICWNRRPRTASPSTICSGPTRPIRPGWRRRPTAVPQRRGASWTGICTPPTPYRA
ncbi:AAA family ATPase [Streptomyces sp. NPDC001700]